MLVWHYLYPTAQAFNPIQLQCSTASHGCTAAQAEQLDAQRAGDSTEAEDWRYKLHRYLDQLFQKDQTAGADYHALQVRLALHFAPSCIAAAHQSTYNEC